MTADRYRTASFVLILALAAFVVISVIGHGLFVFTEARQSVLSPFPRVEAARFFLFPSLQWGAARLSGAASFHLTGALCGPNAECVNGVGAVLVAVAMVVLVLHTLQLVRSMALTAVVAVLWCLSPVVLGITLWQAARYDLLAFIVAIACGGLWWAVLGRAALSWVVGTSFVATSLIMLATAFNAKELTYYLPAIMLILAVLRAPQGRVRRNLVLITLPLVYSAWFIAYALTHINPVYASYVGRGSIIDGVPDLMTATLGMSRAYMSLWQGGVEFNRLAYWAALGYVLALVLFVVAGVAAWSARRRLRGSAARPSGERVWRADPPAIPPSGYPAWRADPPAIPPSGYSAWYPNPGPAAASAVGGPPASSRSRRLHAWGHDNTAEVYLFFTFLFTLLIGARSVGATAYYMPIGYWALLALVVLVARRIARPLPHPRVVLAILLVAVSVPALVGYAAHLSATSAWRKLMTTSERVDDLGAGVRLLLADRPVKSVAWRTLEEPETYFYVTRFGAEGKGGAYIWPFLMGARVPLPEFTSLAEGTTDELAAEAGRYAGPGQVLLVISADYGLQLLAYEGQIIYQAPDSGPPP